MPRAWPWASQSVRALLRPDWGFVFVLGALVVVGSGKGEEGATPTILTPTRLSVVAGMKRVVWPVDRVTAARCGWYCCSFWVEYCMRDCERTWVRVSSSVVERLVRRCWTVLSERRVNIVVIFDD